MTIQLITGNIWKTKAQTIVNTINCEGYMGAGIALECRLRFPSMYEEYQALCQEGKLQPGLLWLYKKENPWILNFPTKNLWRLPTKEEYLHAGLKKFVDSYESRQITSIAFPLLGASHGGLSVERSLAIMQRYLEPLPLDIEIYQYDPTASDDLFEELKALLLSQENDIDHLKTMTGIGPQYLTRIIDSLKTNAKLCQVNQLISINGVGVATLEKLFSYMKDAENTGVQQGFNF